MFVPKHDDLVSFIRVRMTLAMIVLMHSICGIRNMLQGDFIAVTCRPR